MVLESERGHIAGGHVMEAVAAYDRAYRLAPDPQVARKILCLRRDAMSTRSFTPGPSTWPPELPDPFPGRMGPPEVEADAAWADVLGGSIVHHGCLIVRGMLDRETADNLSAETARAIA